MSDLSIPRPTRRCTKCGNEYPATTEYFYAKKGVKSGLAARCRECVRQDIYDKRTEDPEPHRAAARKYYYGHKEACLAKSAQWQRDNPQKVRASTRQWELKNPDHVREYHRRWNAENHDRILEQKRRWRAANPEVARAQWQRRYARKNAAEGRATAADLRAIRAAQTDKKGRLICWACQTPIIGNEPPPHMPLAAHMPPELDHWIPLDKDGTHNPGNLHYMHGVCNRSKGGKHPTELGRLL